MTRDSKLTASANNTNLCALGTGDWAPRTWTCKPKGKARAGCALDIYVYVSLSRLRVAPLELLFNSYVLTVHRHTDGTPFHLSSLMRPACGKAQSHPTESVSWPHAARTPPRAWAPSRNCGASRLTPATPGPSQRPPTLLPIPHTPHPTSTHPLRQRARAKGQYPLLELGGVEDVHSVQR